MSRNRTMLLKISREVDLIFRVPEFNITNPSGVFSNLKFRGEKREENTAALITALAFAPGIKSQNIHSPRSASSGIMFVIVPNAQRESHPLFVKEIVRPRPRIDNSHLRLTG